MQSMPWGKPIGTNKRLRLGRVTLPRSLRRLRRNLNKFNLNFSKPRKDSDWPRKWLKTRNLKSMIWNLKRVLLPSARVPKGKGLHPARRGAYRMGIYSSRVGWCPKTRSSSHKPRYRATNGPLLKSPPSEVCTWRLAASGKESLRRKPLRVTSTLYVSESRHVILISYNSLEHLSDQKLSC